MTPLAIREIVDRSIVIKYWALVVAFATFLSVGGMTTLVTVLASPAVRPTLPGGGPALPVTLGILALALVPLLGLSLLFALGTRRRTISPLLSVDRKEYVVCAEGVYTLDLMNARRRRYHRLHSWSTLSLFVIDEPHRVLALRGDRGFLKLQAEEGFAELRDTVLAHLPDARPERTRPPVFRWGIVGTCFGLIVAINLGGAIWLGLASTGQVDDGLCDVCGREATASLIETTYVYTDANPPGVASSTRTVKAVQSVVVHEYCDQHALLYMAFDTATNHEFDSKGIAPDRLYQVVWAVRVTLLAVLVLATVFSLSPYMWARQLDR